MDDDMENYFLIFIGILAVCLVTSVLLFKKKDVSEKYTESNYCDIYGRNCDIHANSTPCDSKNTIFIRDCNLVQQS